MTEARYKVSVSRFPPRRIDRMAPQCSWLLSGRGDRCPERATWQSVKETGRRTFVTRWCDQHAMQLKGMRGDTARWGRIGEKAC